MLMAKAPKFTPEKFIMRFTLNRTWFPRSPAFGD
jgi:hypothetical protein